MDKLNWVKEYLREHGCSIDVALEAYYKHHGFGKVRVVFEAYDTPLVLQLFKNLELMSDVDIIQKHLVYV